ncbi:At-hook motif nuclear-localized protein [Thalictrum thalictroides]|uniref:AT-hook motif nuclear-localized protein n=1 Tax=Thalictrum thalictroides TaxID=46969 RepID=A0A7J6V1B5_THATH|nr:At-hook motif nuclear-localized protein [Thalictrum thalictroides]
MEGKNRLGSDSPKNTEANSLRGNEVPLSLRLSAEAIPAGGHRQKRKQERPKKNLEGMTDMLGGLSSPSCFSAKRARGQPLVSGDQGIVAPVGGGFTPYIVIANRGEDVMTKILSIFQFGSWSACILAANGPLYNATINYTGSHISTKCEGRFEILSLSGTITVDDSNGSLSKICTASLSMAGIDGRVSGGKVLGPLMAAGCVQVVLGILRPTYPR